MREQRAGTVEEARRNASGAIAVWAPNLFPWQRSRVDSLLTFSHSDVDWIETSDDWASRHVDLRILIVSDVRSAEVKAALQAAACRDVPVLVLSFDDPLHLRHLLPFPIADILSLPTQAAELGRAIDRLIVQPDRMEAVIRHVGNRPRRSMISAAIRAALECAPAGSARPPASIREVAARIGCSRSYLSEEQEGFPLARFLRLVRIVRALEERRTTGKRWSEVAQVVGYRGVSGLQQAVSQLLGMGLKGLDSNNGGDLACAELVKLLDTGGDAS